MLDVHTFLVIMKLELYGYDCEYPGTKKGNTVVAYPIKKVPPKARARPMYFSSIMGNEEEVS